MAIKGIVVEIGGNTMQLDKALKGSTTESKNLGSELSQINRQLKFNPDNIMLLTQKQDVLTERVKVTTEKLEQLESVKEQIERQVANGDLGADKYRAYQREVEETRSKLNHFKDQLKETKKAVSNFESGINNTNLDEFEKELQDVKDKADEFKTSLKDTAKDIGSDFAKVGAGVAAGTTAAVTSFDSVQSALNHIQAQTGLDKSVINSYKEVIDLLYSDNYGEDKTDIATAMSAIIQTTKETDSTKIKEYTANLITLRDTFGFEYAESLRSADMLTKQWGIDSEKAYNLIVQGAQKGLNKNGDLLDVINEYSVHYKQLGYSPEQFFNSLSNGAEAGAFSVDKLGDAMKEFGIRTKDTAESTGEAYEILGLKGSEMRKMFAEGGESAQQATQIVLSALFNLDDQVKQNQAGVGLFGTMWEDLGIDGVKALMNVQGSADATVSSMEKIKDVKYDDVKNGISSLARTAQTELLDPLVEEYYPEIKEAIEWTGENLEDLEPILIAIAGISASIFVGHKVSTYAKAIGELVTMYKAYKTASDAATVSQTALNTAQSANVVGLVVTAVGLLISGVMALSATMNENKEVTYKVTDAQKELYENIDETTESYKNARKARREAVSEIESEYAYYRKLYNQLKKITNQNGKVKKGYEEKAQFIATTLSNALDVEISMTGNQIYGYQNLKAELKEVIKLQEQRALLSAYEADYVNAQKEIGSNKQSYAIASSNLIEAQTNYDTKNEARRNALFELNQSDASKDPFIYREKLEAYNKALAEFNKAEQNLQEAQKKYNAAEKNYVANNTIIANYTAASEAIISGNNKKIEEALTNLTNEFIKAEDGTKKSLRRQYNNAKEGYEKIKEAYENGVTGITKNDLRAARQLKNQAKREFKKFKDANRDAGEQSAKELKDGYIITLNESLPQIFTTASKMPTVALQGIRNAQDSHSPSRKSRVEGNNFVDGYILPVKERQKEAANEAKNLVNGVMTQMQKSQKQLQNSYFSTNFNTKVFTEMSAFGGNNSVTPPINVNFNNVTVNTGDDINSLADKFSERIAKNWRRKGL